MMNHGLNGFILSNLPQVETECHDLKELGDQREEQLKSANKKLQERSSERESEIKDMKDTIFELEDQVEQHRAVKLHNNQLLSDLENKVDKLEEQKQDLERQLRLLTKQMKEDAEEWKRFQADLQTAVVVANDIKCEAQQELRSVKRRLQEEEERTAHLHRELEDVRGSRADKVRLCRSRSVNTRRGRHRKKIGGPRPDSDTHWTRSGLGPPLGYIGGLSTALQNSVDKPLMLVDLAHLRFWG
ncbi:unnamed protein product [Ranitomeya imitator]|uniref:Uncharacterized protein n=1 Tax=Ranitomeya imitator TaxID=111125 RepID=A0ABN9M616_9NEOB|nr:unnamed protein product [Ranitomeya imitator]